MGHNTRAAANIQDTCSGDVYWSVKDLVAHHLEEKNSLSLQSDMLLEAVGQVELAVLVGFASLWKYLLVWEAIVCFIVLVVSGIFLN